MGRDIILFCPKATWLILNILLADKNTIMSLPMEEQAIYVKNTE